MKKNEKLYINGVFIGDVKKSIYRKINIGKSSEVTHRNMEVEFSDVNDSKKLKNIEITNKVLSDELDKEVQLRFELQMEVAGLQNKVNDLNCKNHQLQNELTYCARIKEQLCQSLRDLETSNVFLNQEVSKLQDYRLKNETLIEEINRLKIENEKLITKNKAITDAVKMNMNVCYGTSISSSELKKLQTQLEVETQQKEYYLAKSVEFEKELEVLKKENKTIANVNHFFADEIRRIQKHSNLQYVPVVRARDQMKTQFMDLILDYMFNDITKGDSDMNKQTTLKIEKVFFNNPTTVVIFNDGTKVISKCGKDDIYDETIGLAMCITKKMFGNGSQLSKYVKQVKKENQAILDKKTKKKQDKLQSKIEKETKTKSDKKEKK